MRIQGNRTHTSATLTPTLIFAGAVKDVQNNEITALKTNNIILISERLIFLFTDTGNKIGY